jgi:hypothetical protein
LKTVQRNMSIDMPIYVAPRRSYWNFQGRHP